MLTAHRRHIQEETPAQLTTDERYRAMCRVTNIGSVVDLGLGILKIVTGWLAHSQALIADGVHSLSDLATNLVVLFAAKEAHREADEQHPYGHDRIETMATVGLGGALVLVGLGIGYDALRRVFQPELLWQPGAFALVVAVVSVFAKEAIYRYTMRLARRLGSNLLRANAWHARSDAISSMIVIVGVSGAMAGYPHVDAIAAVAVAAMIARIGVNLMWGSARELIDTGVEAEALAGIRDVILAVDGVNNLHTLRTRRMGGKVLVDVHITLADPRVSVSEGHQVSEAVMTALMGAMDEVSDVTVHIDPEDDELSPPNRHLPLRTQVLQRLERRWSTVEAADQIQGVNLHYLGGKVHVEVILPVALAADAARAAALERAFGSAVGEDGEIGQVRVLFGDAH